jgi:hypothetical protein
MKRTGRNAQFTNHTLTFIEFKFPGFVVHGKRACKTYRCAIAAIDALFFLKMNAFVKRFANNVLLFQVFNSFFNVFFFSLKFKEEASALARINFSLQNVDTDIVIFYQMVTERFVAAVGRKLRIYRFLIIAGLRFF